MIAFQKGVNGASVAALKAGNDAQTLAGTNPRKNHAYHDIEDQAVALDAARGEAYGALGDLVSAEFSDARVTTATQNVVAEGRDELKLLGLYSSSALQYERMLNRKNKRVSGWLVGGLAVISPVAALGFLAGENGARTTTSHTTAQINGNQINATTTTTGPGPDEIARSFAQAASDAQTTERLEAVITAFEPQIQDSTYSFNPLIQHWIRACRAAGQL